jgi:hypothetical protein
MKSFTELNLGQRYQNKIFLKEEVTFVLRINPPRRMVNIATFAKPENVSFLTTQPFFGELPNIGNFIANTF